MAADDGGRRGWIGLVLDALRDLAAREQLPDAPAETQPRRPGLWRTLVAREPLPETAPVAPREQVTSLSAMLTARETLPPPPPAAPRSPSFWRWITSSESLPEETDDGR